MRARALLSAASAGLLLVAGAFEPVGGRPAALGPGRSVPLEPVAVVGGLTPISDVNTDNPSNPGFSILEFQIVTIEGVAQIGTGVLDPLDDDANLSTWFYVSDGSGGLAIAERGAIGTSVSKGDSVRVTAFVATQGAPPIGGTRTLDLGFGSGSLTVIGSGVVDVPRVIPADSIAANGGAYEGSSVRIGGLSVVDPGEWPAAGSSAFVTLTDGTTQIEMYLDDDTNIPGSSPPAAVFDLVGFVSQNSPSPPFPSDHYVYPASLSDLIVGDGSGLVTVVPNTVAEMSTDVTLAFTLVGQAVNLESMEIEIPSDWTWTPTNPLTSGDGFLGASAGYRFEGGRHILTVDGAAVTSADHGTLTVSGLGAPVSVRDSEFTTWTATAGGTLTGISSHPVVFVVTAATPADILVNEVYPVVTGGGREHSEFVELRSRSAADLDIGGWTVTDIGRTLGCGPDARWVFPLGTILPAGEYLVVCRTALDPQNPGNPNDDEGFLVDFPAFPPSPGVQLFELYDSSIDSVRTDPDHPGTPNLLLLDQTPFVDDQISLLGGPVTNGEQCRALGVPGVPFAELVVLWDATGQAIDALEYQAVGPCEGDFCTEGPGAGEAYPLGPPKAGHTLGRAGTTHTGHSRLDIRSAFTPTPGESNLPGDNVAPEFVIPDGAALSSSVVEVLYDEPVHDPSARDVTHYSVLTGGGESVEVVEVLADGSFPGLHYLVVTAGAPAGEPILLDIEGIVDVELDANGEIQAGTNVLTGSATFQVSQESASICRVQEFDEIGFSPLMGDTVLVAGYVTVGDIPPVFPDSVPKVDRLSIWVQEPGGCGVNVFSFLTDDGVEYNALYQDLRKFGVQINDFVQVRGEVTEFVSSSSGAGAVTEIELNPNLQAGAGGSGPYRFIGRGFEGPAPIEVSTREANDERLEGTLVHTTGVVINANALALYLDDNSGSIQVFQNFSALDFTRFTVGDNLDVTGIITQFDSSSPYFAGYELVPQNQETIFKTDGDFASSEPTVEVQKRVLVPDLGETIRITATSPARSQMIVEIYDMLGRKVTTLYDGVGLGAQTFDWNGVNQWGSVVDAGAYVCHVRAVALDGGPVRTASAPIIVGLRLNGGRP